MSYIGTTELGKTFLGSTEIAKAYLGNDLVFVSGESSGGGGGTPDPDPTEETIGGGAYRKKTYVISSSPSTITTDITAVDSQWLIDAQFVGTHTSGNLVLICSDDATGHFFGVCSNGKWGSGATYSLSVDATTRSTINMAFSSAGVEFSIGNESKTRLGSARHPGNVNLLGYNNNYKFTGRIYGIKCVSGGSFEAVPAQRISDDVFGLYDIENDVFYSGNYTGE